MWFAKTHLPLQNKVALVTGASQGLGAEIALQLYRENCSVILVARRQAVLDEQVARIKKLHGEKDAFVKAIAVDVCEYDQCTNMWTDLAADGIDPDYFFSCVGGSTCKLFPDLTKDELANGVNTNYISTLYPVHTGVKHVLSTQKAPRSEYKKRHIILFSSVAAVYPLIGYSQYAPLKSALLSMSITLRQELKAYNYRVSCVLPGNFLSEGYEEEEKTKPSITKDIEGLSVPIGVDKCADIVLSSLARGYDIVYTDLIGWVLGSASLGAHPRVLAILQIIVSFIFLLIAPVASLVVENDILKFFVQRDRKRE